MFKISNFANDYNFLNFIFSTVILRILKIVLPIFCSLQQSSRCLIMYHAATIFQHNFFTPVICSKKTFQLNEYHTGLFQFYFQFFVVVIVTVTGRLNNIATTRTSSSSGKQWLRFRTSADHWRLQLVLMTVTRILHRRPLKHMFSAHVLIIWRSVLPYSEAEVSCICCS